MHVTSLPSAMGIGDLGESASNFVDFLVSSKQAIWQILPVGPPAEGNSPYSAYSAFAGNPLLIDLDQLVGDSLLQREEITQAIESGPEASESKVDFETAAARKLPLLGLAFERFCQLGDHPIREEFVQFCSAHVSWLHDYSRFEAFLGHFEQSDWSRWPASLVSRDPDALAEHDQLLKTEIEFSKFKQFLFEKQWIRLKAEANEKGVLICGDLPIFVAYESADVWAQQELFAVDQKGRPEFVAGVPPDYFSKTGQLWGNPLYRWDVLEETNFNWWTRRFASDLRRFDLLRVDHFRGFEAYWEVPASAKTAVSGKWQPGPGAKPFLAARERLGELPFIAEDLGMITQPVHDLRDELGLPGMRVLQFGFDQEHDDFHRPNSYPEHSVAYTGTHDNDTLVGWLNNRKPGETPDPLDKWVNCGSSDGELSNESSPIHWQLIAAVMDSAADTVIIPIQDVLGLGNEARMNVPGKAKGNWGWRVGARALTGEIAEQLSGLVERASRH